MDGKPSTLLWLPRASNHARIRLTERAGYALLTSRPRESRECTGVIHREGAYEACRRRAETGDGFYSLGRCRPKSLRM